MTIPTHLIENALALTGKTMEDMFIMRKQVTEHIWTVGQFSIEKFCFYLLSPEFIEKYMPLLFSFEITYDYEGYLRHTAIDFGEAIHEYQRKDKEFPEGNPEPLINLLEKIPTP